MGRTSPSLIQHKRAFSLLVVFLQLTVSSVVAFLNRPAFRQYSIIPSTTKPGTPRRQLSPFVWTTVLKPPKKVKITSVNPSDEEKKKVLEEDAPKQRNSTNFNNSSDNDELSVQLVDNNITIEDSDYRDLWEVTSSSVAKLGNTSSMIPPFRGINLSMYSTNFPAFSFDSWKNSTYLPQSSSITNSITKGFYQRYGNENAESSSFSRSKTYKSKQRSKGENLSLPPTLTGKIEANDTLTLSDLQEIIQYNGFVRKEDLGTERSGRTAYKDKTKRSKQVSSLVMDDSSSSSSLETAKRRTDGGVAFPQPSILSYSSLRRATTVVCGTYGIVIASTILPNLWLMGLLLGTSYGYGISNFDEDDEVSPSLPDNVIPRFCLESGRKLAKTTLNLYDRWQGLWFLYKTGQLSYEYYKRYEELDQRFAIQDKMDAWNARFQEGKIKFDNWEKENEVGRTILAGLRTVWLVDEQSKRRAKQTSRYRAVQYFYNIQFYIGRGWTRLVSMIRTSNSKFWGEVVNGIREDMKISGMDALQTRIGAVIASLLVFNAAGALYAISAPLLTVLAMMLGIIWPSWVPELAARLQDLLDETRARGRGDEDYVSSRSSSMNMAKVLGRYDKKKYHYYKRPDGSKQYYRTGQSYFRFGTNENEERLAFPWKRKRANKKQKPVNPWGKFGSSFGKSGS